MYTLLNYAGYKHFIAFKLWFRYFFRWSNFTAGTVLEVHDYRIVDANEMLIANLEQNQYWSKIDGKI